MLLTQWIFCWSLISTSLIAVSASIPLYTWASLEINTIAFIPMMLDPNKPEAIRSAMKYFFVQAYASLIFLVGPLLNTLPEMTIIIAMIMKLGMSPFHNWYPSVMADLNWMAALFLSTWQKIAPLWILSENTYSFFMFPALAALNAIIGGIGGMMQTEIRPLLAFSSIGHMGWLMYSMIFSNFITIIYFISYVLHLMILMYYMHYMKINTPKDLSSLVTNSQTNKMILALTLLSLGGLPPLLGFIPKLLVLATLSSLTLPPLLLMIGSYMNIYYYMSVMWSSFMSSPQPTLMSKLINPMTLAATTLSSLLALMLM